ncbi:MAG: MFS transporter [Pseudomonadota bacterium]
MTLGIAITDRKSARSLLLPCMVWGVSSLFVTFQMLLQTSPSVMIADLQQAFSIDTLGVSLLSTSFFYTYVLLQIPAGMLIDRVHPRYCLAACFVGVSLMTVMFALSHNLEMARTSRILQGLFSAPSVVPALYLAAIWFPARYFALLAGLTEMIGMSGSAVGQLVLAPCSGLVGWRVTLLICAAIGFVMALCTLLIIRNKPTTANTTTTATAPHQTHIFRSLLIVISCPQAWINGLFSGLLFSISAAFGAFWCIPYLMKIYNFTLNSAAAASSMVLFGVALGAPVLGGISDRINLRKLPMIVSTAAVLVLMLIIMYVPNINLTLLFLLLFALGFFSAAYALPFAVIREIMPNHVRGTAMGYTNMMCILIGAPVLQPLIGWLLDRELLQTTNVGLAYQHAMLALPVSLAIGLVLAFFVRETYCGNVKP